MKAFMSEYGRFIIAVISGSFIFYFMLQLIANFKVYSSNYIRAITGVEDTQYVGSEPDG